MKNVGKVVGEDHRGRELKENRTVMVRLKSQGGRSEHQQQSNKGNHTLGRIWNWNFPQDKWPHLITKAFNLEGPSVEKET